MNVTLDPVTSALWPALANLAQFYQYDFSEIENGIVNLAGRFTYVDLGVLEHRLKEPGAEAWLFRVTDSEWGQDTLAGFAIALPAPDHPGAREIDEFFVMRAIGVLGLAVHQRTRFFGQPPDRGSCRVRATTPGHATSGGGSSLASIPPLT